MSKIRVLTYRLDIYNLQTKIVLFADQKKLLWEVMLVLQFLWMPIQKTLKSNIAKVQNMLSYKEPTCTIYWSEKTPDKWPRVKSYLLKYATIKNL